MRYVSILVACGALLSTDSSLVRGDTFHLRTGGRLEGSLLNPEESPRKTYAIQTNSGGRIVLRADEVDRVERKSDLELSYEQFARKLPQTVEAHWDAAERCLKADLTEQRQYHLQQVLKLDPEHEDARRALGYRKIQGNWWTQEQWMKSRGYVLHQGRWRLPLQVEIETREKEQQQREVEWRVKIRRWNSWIVRRRGDESEGARLLREIRDPPAAPALVELLRDDDQPTSLKLLYIEILGQLRSGTATGALAELAIASDDPAIREKCLDQLEAQESSLAVSAFVKTLQNNDNKLVNRAAAGLARMRDPSAIPPLVDALSTKHRFLVSPQAGINAGFSNMGTGFQAGGKPKLVEVEYKNKDVLAALAATVPTGINFGYDKDAWRAWYIEVNTPQVVDLRRDD